MKHWTDEELGALISEALNMHEADADPSAAQRVASRAGGRRPLWPAAGAAAAVVGLIVGTSALLTGPGDEIDSPSNHPTSVGPAFDGVRTGTDAEYRADAVQEGRRILSLVKTPTDATQIAGPPPSWPHSDYVPLGLADRRLLQSSWYSTSLSADEVEDFLLTHPPSGFAKTRPGLARRASGLRYFAYDTAERKDPEVVVFSRILVEWHQVGGRTTIRFETVMLSRRARTMESVITGVVSRVDVDRVRRNLSSRNFLESNVLTRATVTDSVRTTALVNATNALYGSDDPVFFGHCPFPGDPPPGTTLTFHTSVAVWTFSWTSSCFDQVRVRRDGKQLDVTLNPSGLERIVDQMLD